MEFCVNYNILYVHKSVFAALIELDFMPSPPPLLIKYPKEKMHLHKMEAQNTLTWSECKTVAVQYYRSLCLSFSDYCMNALSCFEFYIGQIE